MNADVMTEAFRPQVDIQQGRRGLSTVCVTGEDGKEVYLHSLYDPVREAEAFLPGIVSQKTAVFLGIGLGYHILPFLDLNPHVDHVVIIDIYPELASAAAARLKGSGIRVDIVTTSACGQDTNPQLPDDLGATGYVVIPHPPSISANPTWYSRCRASVAMSGAVKSDKTLNFSERPLKILFLFGSYYCQVESIRGFEALGHRVIVLDYREGEISLVDRFTEILRNEKPDLVFSINMRGLDGKGVMGEILSAMKIPLVLWFVDSPEFILYGEALPPADICRIFVWEKSYIPFVESLGYWTRYLPLGGDPALAEAARSFQSFSGRCFICRQFPMQWISQ